MAYDLFFTMMDANIVFFSSKNYDLFKQKINIGKNI